MNFMMQVREAFFNLMSAKLRSFLAILGILVGTGSVVAMVSSGELATAHALLQFQQLGTDLLSLSIYEESSGEGAATKAPKLTVLDVLKLKKIVTGIREIAPYTTLYSELSFDGNKLEGNIIGATDSLQEVIQIQLQKGRFITSFDQFSSFCVIGNGLAKDLKAFGITNPLNMQIRLGNNIYDYWCCATLVGKFIFQSRYQSRGDYTDRRIDYSFSVCRYQ